MIKENEIWKMFEREVSLKENAFWNKFLTFRKELSRKKAENFAAENALKKFSINF